MDDLLCMKGGVLLSLAEEKSWGSWEGGPLSRRWDQEELPDWVILHPQKLPTGQGHLKIKSVLAWQPFLTGQSPNYHEVVRWLAPSMAIPGFLKITLYHCFGSVHGFGAWESWAKGMLDGDIGWLCLSSWHSHSASW